MISQAVDKISLCSGNWSILIRHLARGQQLCPLCYMQQCSVVGEGMDFTSRIYQFLAVNFGKFLKLSESQVFHLYNGGINIFCLRGL